MSKIWGNKGDGKRIRPTADISNSSTSKGMFLLYGLEKWFSTNQKSDKWRKTYISALSSATMLAYLVCNSRQASRYQAVPPHSLPSCRVPCLLLEILLDEPQLQFCLPESLKWPGSPIISHMQVTESYFQALVISYHHTVGTYIQPHCWCGALKQGLIHWYFAACWAISSSWRQCIHRMIVKWSGPSCDGNDWLGGRKHPRSLELYHSGLGEHHWLT